MEKSGVKGVSMVDMCMRAWLKLEDAFGTSFSFRLELVINNTMHRYNISHARVIASLHYHN